MSNPLLDPAARVVVAHRGNRSRAPENTLIALQDAIELGVDAIEFDVRATRDGVPILLHDAALDRTTNAVGPVSSYSASEIERVRSRGAAVIPTLEMVLDQVRSTPLVIDVKELRVAPAAEALMRRFAAVERILIGSAESDVVEYFRGAGFRVCASMNEAVRLVPRALLGGTARGGYHVLSITPRFRQFPIPVLSMARAARRAGKPTQVWTVNDARLARHYWENGVAGIVTDDPAAILKARTP